jgi:hypothetical protein
LVARVFDQCSVFTHGLGDIQRMHASETFPIGDCLVVNDDIGLGEESRETTFYSEVPGGSARVFGTHTAPAIELGA